jgi:hypothetical protein
LQGADAASRLVNMPRPLHVRRFTGGRYTPQEYHAAHLPPGAFCAGCGARPSLQARVFLPYDEAEKRGYVPSGAMASPDVLARTTLLREASGDLRPYVRLSEAYACAQCRPAFERQLAKAPSWAIVEINRGPDPTNRVSLGG